ncbi:YicC-like domain-containing protein [Thermodesulfatator indicus DSM 15286]|uniref:YicC-like domain-containing protein n=1 Tax=Thermodesulfatator indicus (strain DSM 15286 / JCM 11887 / CIR29812) TaxID=667014 RepID=F8A8G5_THEID|nr:YicC/YloC family endoribonuclease [Thermodesulfatator indicus]AEH43972.1 YicC-like domain-containing protein [Thermodesulfatator indicus DSM 15286]
MSLKSMTGFGRAEEVRDTWSLRVEIKSVNHRFLEIVVRLPRRYQVLEERIRRTLRERFSRGRFDIYVQLVGSPPTAQSLSFNETLARQYVESLRYLKVVLGLAGDIEIKDLLRMREVFQAVEAEEDLEALWEELSPALIEALDHLATMREEEGKFLEGVLRDQLSKLKLLVEEIEKRRESAFLTAKKRLEDRIKKLLSDKELDPLRLHQEVVILADRTDFTEELDRLKSHIGQFEKAIEEPGPHGRKLDFLIQEMFREINTLSNKAANAEISQLAVEVKCTLEKMREQIQNIE